jgi:glycosyltransferase involved in cell wall biosynthesis
MLRLLYVYKVATFGGVERVLLSRAEAFKQHGMQVKISLYFYEDLGAIEAIQKYIDDAGLTEYISLVTTISEDEYDFIISIDTPEIFKLKISSKKLLFECHTTYLNSRKYLSRLPNEVRMIAVPSIAMKIDLENERPELKNRIVVLRNFVSARPVSLDNLDKFWQKRPLLYLGRMDEHKNIREVLDIFQFYRTHHGDDLMLVLVGMVAESINLVEELRRRNLVDRTVLFPPVRFDRVGQVYSLVKAHKGIFISSSQDESFGLSVAEALVNGLPVLLSGTGAHAELVNNDLDFLYPLGDVLAGAEKLKNIACNYEQLHKKIEDCKGRFSVDLFIENWNCFVTELSS